MSTYPINSQKANSRGFAKSEYFPGQRYGIYIKIDYSKGEDDCFHVNKNVLWNYLHISENVQIFNCHNCVTN